MRPCAGDIQAIAELVTAVAAVAAGGGAAWTYYRSLKLERAKWMKELYEKFYEDDGLKKTRDLLDAGDRAAVLTEVENETAPFTDYLNFFEFLSYLYESGQISMREISGLFDYYLADLKQNPDVASYINNPAKGFEKLSRLLKEASQ